MCFHVHTISAPQAQTKLRVAEGDAARTAGVNERLDAQVQQLARDVHTRDVRLREATDMCDAIERTLSKNAIQGDDLVERVGRLAVMARETGDDGAVSKEKLGLKITQLTQRLQETQQDIQVMEEGNQLEIERLHAIICDLQVICFFLSFCFCFSAHVYPIHARHMRYPSDAKHIRPMACPGRGNAKGTHLCLGQRRAPQRRTVQAGT